MKYFESISTNTMEALGIDYLSGTLPSLLTGFYPDGLGHFTKKDTGKKVYAERKHFEVLYPERNYINQSVNGVPAEIFFAHDPIPNPDEYTCIT
jgi:hypothetical protein